jgi:hypothetical protein
MYLFATPAVSICRMYLFASPAVWTCRVYPFHCQSCGRAGCIHTASRVDVQDVSLSTTSSVGVQGVTLSTSRSMDRRGVSIPPPALWTCRVSLSTPSSVNMLAVSFSTSEACRVHLFPPLSGISMNAKGSCMPQHRQLCRRAGCFFLPSYSFILCQNAGLSSQFQQSAGSTPSSLSGCTLMQPVTVQ